MGYLHIDNLYKNQEIMMFDECYALEKIHGTSAHISFSLNPENMSVFSGGEKHERFVSLFDEESLLRRFKEQFPQLCAGTLVTLYGEAYGGKQQGMSATYGKDLKFIVFDVKVGECWLSVPDAEQVTLAMGLEFVWYSKVPADIESLNKLRDSRSVQSIRNGLLENKKWEGVVLRPLIEMTKNNGKRIICKHKGDDFRETKTSREVDPEKIRVLKEAQAIADEWVTPMRMSHVLDKMPADVSMEQTGDVIRAMMKDVLREGEGEFVDSRQARSAIGKKAAGLFKEFLQKRLQGD